MVELNWVLGTLVATNFMFAFITFRTRAIIGPKYWKSVIKAIGLRFSKPIHAVWTHKSQFTQQEVMDARKIETDTPMTLNEDNRYHSEGEFKTYFFGEGQTENYDPLKANTKLYEILKRLGLVTNKYIDYREERLRSNIKSNILDKEHFNKVALVGGLALLAIGYFMFNIVSFADNAQLLYDQWVPILEQQIENVPRLVENTGAALTPQGLLDSLNSPGG